MNIGSIFVALGFKADTKQLNNFNTGIKSLKTNLVLTTAAFAGAVYGFKQFVDSGVKAASSLVNFNRQTGLSIDKLNQFAQVGQSLSLGLDVNNITNDILNLEKTIARVKLGQGSIQPFQMLGVSIHGQNAFGVLDQLRNSVKNLSDINATILLEDLGLNPNFLQILKLSNAEFDKLAKNNFLKAGQAKSVEQLGLKMRALTTTFTNLKNQAIVKFTPYLIEALKGISNFIVRIERIVDVGAKFINSLSGIDRELKILAIGFGALTLATRPFLLGLTAIFLLLDDIAVWKMGGKSLFGDFYDTLAKIPNIENILGIGGAIAGIAILTGNIKTLGLVLSPIVRSFALILAGIAGIKHFTGIPNVVATNEKQVGENINFAREKTIKILDFFGIETPDKLKKEILIPDFLQSKNGQNQNTSNNNINLTINTTKDNALEIASEVEKALVDLLKPAVNNMNNVY